jgi:hypothetical protein
MAHVGMLAKVKKPTHIIAIIGAKHQMITNFEDTDRKRTLVRRAIFP